MRSWNGTTWTDQQLQYSYVVWSDYCHLQPYDVVYDYAVSTFVSSQYNSPSSVRVCLSPCLRCWYIALLLLTTVVVFFVRASVAISLVLPLVNIYVPDAAIRLQPGRSTAIECALLLWNERKPALNRRTSYYTADCSVYKVSQKIGSLAIVSKDICQSTRKTNIPGGGHSPTYWEQPELEPVCFLLQHLLEFSKPFSCCVWLSATPFGGGHVAREALYSFDCNN